MYFLIFLRQVNWHTVFWGIALQYLFAVLILRTYWGYTLFDWCGERVREFLDHASNGIVFVFGEKASDHSFAMMVNIFILGLFTVMWRLIQTCGQ